MKGPPREKFDPIVHISTFGGYELQLRGKFIPLNTNILKIDL